MPLVTALKSKGITLRYTGNGIGAREAIELGMYIMIPNARPTQKSFVRIGLKLNSDGFPSSSSMYHLTNVR